MLIIFGIRAGPDNVFPNALLHALNNAANSLCSQSDCGQGGYFFGAHALPEIKPENHTVALAVGARQSLLQAIVDLTQDDCKSDLLLAPVRVLAVFWIDVPGGHMRLVATRRLTMRMLEIVVCGVGSGFLQVSQNCFGMLDGKSTQKATTIFP